MDILTPEQLIQRCGGTQAATARRLGVTRAAVNQWVKLGKVPELRLYKLSDLTPTAETPPAVLPAP